MATLKLLLGVGVMVAVGFLGLKFLPPYFTNYQFEDYIKETALHSTYTALSEDDIRDQVVKQAKDYDIDLTPRQVHVSRTGDYGSGTLSIEADYSVAVNLPGYSATLEFHPSSNNRGVF
jgi:hypothetical protein